MTKKLDRRQFTLETALAALSGVAITVSGCGGSSPSAPSGGGGGGGGGGSAPPTDGVTGSISANHGHSARITQMELDAGNAVTVELTEGDGHTHSADLSADQVMAIAAGNRVSVTSTNDNAHTHVVTFN